MKLSPDSDQPPVWVEPVMRDAFRWMDANRAELGEPMTFEQRLDMTVTLEGRKQRFVLTVRVEQK